MSPYLLLFPSSIAFPRDAAGSFILSVRAAKALLIALPNLLYNSQHCYNLGYVLPVKCSVIFYTFYCIWTFSSFLGSIHPSFTISLLECLLQSVSDKYLPYFFSLRVNSKGHSYHRYIKTYGKLKVSYGNRFKNNNASHGVGSSCKSSLCNCTY